MTCALPIRLLTVADSSVLRMGLREMLASEDISIVAEACTVADAIEMARQERPDVAVIDLRDPSQIDLRTCGEFHTQGYGCRVLMLLVPSDEETILDLILDGASGYLFENVGAEELRDAVRVVHQGGSPVDPHIAAVIANRMRLHSSGSTSPLAPLSGDELEIVARIVRGETNHQIGRILHLPDQTVKHRVSDILKKIHAKNRVAAAAWWVRHNRADTAQRGQSGLSQ